MSVESTTTDSGRPVLPKGGLEPPCPCEHNALNVACLPISPLRLEAYDTVSSVVCQYLAGALHIIVEIRVIITVTS